MVLKYIAIAAIAAVALLVCGCAGIAIVIPTLNNELPAGQTITTTGPAVASDQVVGTWKLADPVITEGQKTIELNDSRWTFGADGSYKYNPLLIEIFKTTGKWARTGNGRYEVVCGSNSEVKHFRLADGQLCLEEDPRYVLVRA